MNRNTTYDPACRKVLFRSIRRDSSRIGLGLIAYICIGNLLSIVLYIAYNFITTGTLAITYNGGLAGELIDLAYYVVSFSIGILIIADNGSRLSFKLPKKNGGLALSVMLAMFFPVCLINIASSTFFSSIGIESTIPELVIPSGTLASAVFFIRVAVAPAIIEELMFRGAILGRLRVYGNGFAVVVSSVIFALLHYNFESFPGLFVLALLMGYSAVMSESLFPSMIMHLINNSLAIFSTYFAQNGIEAPLFSLGLVMISVVFLPIAIIGLVRARKRKTISNRIFYRAASPIRAFGSFAMIILLLLIAGTVLLVTEFNFI